VYGRWRPGARTALLRPWCDRMLAVQEPADPVLANALGAQLEDPRHDRRFGLIDPPFHVRPLAGRVGNLDVVIAEDAPAGDVACLAFALRSIASYVRCRAFSRSSSSANAVSDNMILSVGNRASARQR
jgi:hypothetical protein